MEPRIAQETTNGYEVDLEKVNRAAKKVGLFETFYVPPTPEESSYLKRKGLTVLQWRLLTLYKSMFDQELQIRKQEQQLRQTGERIRCNGLCFKQKMLNNEEIAEHVFAEWANRIGINHLYNNSLGEDVHEICFKVFSNSSGRNVYQRFVGILKMLK